jgi:LmbE family N-acetylglucosaminyl deacetylase
VKQTLVCITLACLLSTASAHERAGAVKTQLALDRLTVRASALMIAAHPDDENTALLAWLALGRKVRTGYLSLTRGEGGQNLIGSEQGRLLGVIRTQELLAAREVDGAQQFFTRAVDFGFSKTAEETHAKWGRDQVLGDIVYRIRKFRPDVIVLRFSGTPRDGHGHHQSSAILGKEAFFAAADPSRFPEQLKEVQPWQAKRIVWNVFSFSREDEARDAKLPGRIEVDLGEYNPLLGYSYSEIAGISRSQHRSQGMGSAERRGSLKNYLVHVAGDPAKSDLFDGIAMETDEPALKQAAASFDPRQPEKVVPLLLQARARSERKPEIDEAIALCAGLFLDVSSDRAWVPAGAPVRFTVQAVNRASLPVELVSASVGSVAEVPFATSLEYNTPVTRTAQWQAHRDNAPHEAVFRLRVQGQEITVVRPVWNRYVDKVRGELTRPFTVVPPVSLHLAEPVAVFPTTAPKRVAVLIRAYGPNRSGSVTLQLPPSWKVEPAQRPFTLAADGQQTSLEFEVTAPAAASAVEANAAATVDGTEVSHRVVVIDYPHIPPQTVFEPASAKFVRVPVESTAKRVGYVMGAGDEIARLLPQIGVETVLLNEEDLARGQLSQFDAIVTGVRAYNTRADLRANHHRLMQYVQGGGTMVVQYNVVERGDARDLERIGPFPLKIGRDRVSVEEASVEVLKPEHPLLVKPNRITSADWDGWVQERGLYYASEWDPKYETVIATNDPGEPSRPGGLLYARYGKGVYVFTAYSWFRQLPAGVPGAWRIFANLIGAGRAQ